MWFGQKYDATCSMTPILIHAKTIFEHAASPDGRIRIVDEAGLTRLRDAIRSYSEARTLVTAKWSVRADREKQFITDFTDYVAAESDRKPFEYVFVTNEFDPARLMRACEQLSGNSLMFHPRRAHQHRCHQGHLRTRTRGQNGISVDPPRPATHRRRAAHQP